MQDDVSNYQLLRDFSPCPPKNLGSFISPFTSIPALFSDKY